MGLARILAATAIAAISPAAADAAVVVHSYTTNISGQNINYTPFDVQFGRTLTVPSFDTSLGTLTAVRVLNYGQAHVGMFLDVDPPFCIPFHGCIYPLGQGITAIRLQSSFRAETLPLWVDFSTGIIFVNGEKPEETHTLSFDRSHEYNNPNILRLFQIGSQNLRLSHTLSLNGFFHPPGSGVLGGGAPITHIFYDYTPFDPIEPGPGPTPVPEPASWALMILGFGIIGAALRQKKSRRQMALPAALFPKG